MRIHLPLFPHHFAKPDDPGAALGGGPLARIGGELVLVELQGELRWEGDRANGVVGVLGFDRPERPTLHIGEHHLLHGKIAALPKPYAVIRKARGEPSDPGAAPQAPGTPGTPRAVEGDAADEESDEEHEAEAQAAGTGAGAGAGAPSAKRVKLARGRPDATDSDEGDDDEPPLFPASQMRTPAQRAADLPSSPPAGTHHGYSSDLSSPVAPMGGWSSAHGSDDEDAGGGSARRRHHRRAHAPEERTRHYEVVGVVRKKVIFALRPEPLVTATPLPE